MTADTLSCAAILRHLRQGDFSLLTPAFASADADEPCVLQLLRTGCFDAHRDELDEALTCAAFVGAISVLDHLLRLGVAPEGGAATGLNALHWAANRGELGAVRRLLAAGGALEARNRFGGTVLGATIWASVHEPRDAHVAIVAELLTAGADVRASGYPSGHAAIDALLERAGARKS